MTNSPDVDISIAGCVEEMVRDPNPMDFFFLHFFSFFIMCFVFIRHRAPRRIRGSSYPTSAHERLKRT